MRRRTPLDRLDRLVDVATDVFIERGYRQAQMADVAAAMGVAKGTLYLTVASKEALFDLVVRFADGPRPIPQQSLPVPTPPPGTTLELVRQEIVRQQAPPALTAALARSRPGAALDEVAAIAGELFDVLSANRRRVKLADRAAIDWPELAALWIDGARGGLVGLLGSYLDDRIRRRRLRPVPDVPAAARQFLETCVCWAVHRHWDPQLRSVDDAVARATAVHFLVGALVKE
jgi:AcrR family transcriptional regulator